MREKFVACASAILVFAAGAAFGAYGLWNHSRVTSLENGQAAIVQEANKAFAEVKKELEARPAQAPKLPPVPAQKQ